MNRVPPARALSRGTLFYKKVFPLVWLGAAAFVAAGTLWRMASGADAPFEWVPFLGVAVVGYVITRLVGSELADEVLDAGDHLRVRKGAIEIDVPLREIEGVKESLLQKQPPRIELLLKAPGPFGRVIAFIPSRDSLMPFTRSQLTYELRERVGRAQQEPVHSRSGRRP